MLWAWFGRVVQCYGGASVTEVERVVVFGKQRMICFYGDSFYVID